MVDGEAAVAEIAFCADIKGVAVDSHTMLTCNRARRRICKQPSMSVARIDDHVHALEG